MTTKKIVLIVGSVVVVLGLVVTLFVAGIVGFALYQIGHSEAAAIARTFLRGSEKLKADIGEVQDFGSVVTGSININNDSGNAILYLKVIGANKTVNATVNLLYVKGGKWRVSSASYLDDDGQTIVLLNPYDSKLLVPILIA